MTMTTLQLKLTLPAELAKQAKAAGLLSSSAIEDMLRERLLRQQAGEELRAMMEKLHAANIPPMTAEEIQAEVKAVRKARRAAQRS
jgi:post-segregation antitoxin (ccd killing protein)